VVFAEGAPENESVWHQLFLPYLPSIEALL